VVSLYGLSSIQQNYLLDPNEVIVRRREPIILGLYTQTPPSDAFRAYRFNVCNTNRTITSKYGNISRNIPALLNIFY
jgi:hypothetical protein